MARVAEEIAAAVESLIIDQEGQRVAARCGECVRWSMYEGIEVAVNAVLADPSIRVPIQPDLLEAACVRLIERARAECQGNA
jgi:hypothetical protein